MSTRPAFDPESRTSSRDELLMSTEEAEILRQGCLVTPVGEVYEENYGARSRAIENGEIIAQNFEGSEIGDAVQRLRKGQTTSLTIRGLPIDDDPGSPPADGKAPTHKVTFVSEGITLAVGTLLGDPSIIMGEKDEALIHQITPVAGREETQSNEGTIGLEFHQDLAPLESVPSTTYNRFMPDFLILTGVQPGSGHTRTFIAEVDKAVPQLSPDARKVLYERRFVTNPPASFLKDDAGNFHLPPAHSVLMDYDGHTESAFDRGSGVRPYDPGDLEAAAALEELNAAFMEVRQEVEIEPGTSVAINNRRVVHGRTAIPRESTSVDRRWLQRLYVFDADRVVRESMGRPGGVVLASGVVAVRAGADPERLMQLAGLE